jgi:hypothetical protein
MISHILPDTCPKCGDVVRNDMAVVTDPKTRVRKSGHVQFSCNYEVEVQDGVEPMVLNDCKKGVTWRK